MNATNESIQNSWHANILNIPNIGYIKTYYKVSDHNSALVKEQTKR